MATVQVPSTATTIQIAKASLVYAGRDIRRKALLPNVVDKNLELSLWVASEVLDWTYTNMPSASNIKQMRNYTLALCGAYIVEALSNSGSGGIIITPVNAVPLGFTGYRADFTIGQPGSLMNDGDLSVTINLGGFIDKTVMMFSGINVTIDDTDTGSFDIDSIVYLPTSVTITLSYPVLDGQRYIITGLRYSAAVSPSGGGGTVLPAQDGHEGQVLFTDGAGNLYWGDAHIDYTSASFEADGITVIDTRLEHNTFDLGVTEMGRNLYDSEFTRILSGGFTINIQGFDARVNEYHIYADLKGADSL